MFKILYLVLFSIFLYASPLFYKTASHQGIINDIAVNNDAIYTSSYDGSVIKWSLDAKLLHYYPIDHYGEFITQTQVVAIDNYAISASEDYINSIVAFKNDRFYKLIDSRLGVVNNLAVSKDKKYLVATTSRTLYLYDIKSNFKRVYTQQLEDYDNDLYGIDFLDATTVVLGSWGREIIYFNIKTKKIFRVKTGFRVNDIKVYNNQVIAVGDDTYIHFYDKHGNLVDTFNNNNYIKTIDIKNNFLAVGSLNGVKIYKDKKLYSTIDAKEVKKVLFYKDFLIFNNKETLVIYSIPLKKILFQSHNIINKKNHIRKLRYSKEDKECMQRYSNDIFSSHYKNDTLTINKNRMIIKRFNQYNGYTVSISKWLRIGDGCKLVVGTKMGFTFIFNPDGTLYSELKKDYSRIVDIFKHNKELITFSEQGNYQYFHLDEIQNYKYTFPFVQVVIPNTNSKPAISDFFSNSTQKMFFANDFKLKKSNVLKFKTLWDNTKYQIVKSVKNISLDELDNYFFKKNNKFIVLKPGKIVIYNINTNKVKTIKTYANKAILINNTLIMIEGYRGIATFFNIDTFQINKIKLPKFKKFDDAPFRAYQYKNFFILQVAKKLYYITKNFKIYKTIYLNEDEFALGIYKNKLIIEDNNFVYLMPIFTNKKTILYPNKNQYTRGICSNTIFFTQSKVLYGYNLLTNKRKKYFVIGDDYVENFSCLDNRYIFISIDKTLYSYDLQNNKLFSTSISKKRSYIEQIDTYEKEYIFYDANFLYIYSPQLQLKRKISLKQGHSKYHLCKYKNYIAYIANKEVYLMSYKDNKKTLIKTFKVDSYFSNSAIFFYNNALFIITPEIKPAQENKETLILKRYDLLSKKISINKITTKKFTDVYLYQSFVRKNKFYFEDENNIFYYINLADLSVHKAKLLPDIITKGKLKYNKKTKTISYKKHFFVINQKVENFGETKNYIYATKENLLFVFNKNFSQYKRINFSSFIKEVVHLKDNTVLVNLKNGNLFTVALSL